MKVVQKRILETVDVDFDRIPSHQSDAMCRTLIGCVSKLFEDPAIKADYERWKQERRQRKKQTKDHNLKSYTDKILGRCTPADLFRECEAYARRKMAINELRTGNRYGDDYLPLLIADTIREREFSRYTIKRYTQEAAL